MDGECVESFGRGERVMEMGDVNAKMRRECVDLCIVFGDKHAGLKFFLTSTGQVYSTDVLRYQTIQSTKEESWKKH